MHPVDAPPLAIRLRAARRFCYGCRASKANTIQIVNPVAALLSVKPEATRRCNYRNITARENVQITHPVVAMPPVKPGAKFRFSYGHIISRSDTIRAISVDPAPVKGQARRSILHVRRIITKTIAMIAVPPIPPSF